MGTLVRLHLQTFSGSVDESNVCWPCRQRYDQWSYTLECNARCVAFHISLCFLTDVCRHYVANHTLQPQTLWLRSWHPLGRS